MNAKAIGPTLETLDLIPPEVATEIQEAKSRNNANNCLLKHMKEDTDKDRVEKIMRKASEAKSYGVMNAFANRMLRNQVCTYNS